MPKAQFVDPRAVRKADVIKIKDIPVNRYKSDIEGELRENQRR